jgi:hypothetical protein
LYFNARGGAGLTSGVVAASLGLLFWLAMGTVVVRWYDRRGLQRMPPELLAHISGAVQAYRADQTTKSAPQASVSSTERPPEGDDSES